MYKHADLIVSLIGSNRNKIYSFLSLSLVLTGASVSVPMITRRLINTGIAEGSSSAIVFGTVGELVDGRETLTSQGGIRKVTSNVIQKQSDHIGSMKRLLFTQTRLRTVTGIIRTTGLAVLPQEVFIFNASIRDNIGLGCEEATLEEIEKASALAGIHDEIMKMESGFDTVPGPKGKRLSLGQKRRIALARSILSNPELIILDEPFASLDRDNVLKLAETLRDCTTHCTVIVVSHGWEDELKADMSLSIQLFELPTSVSLNH